VAFGLAASMPDVVPVWSIALPVEGGFDERSCPQLPPTPVDALPDVMPV
jgi:hypothetical protein